MQRKIIFHKLADPFSDGKTSREYVPEEELSDDELDNDLDEVYNYDNEHDHEVGDNRPTPIIVTPMGILMVKPFNNPAHIFSFWLAETNFNVDQSTVDILKKIPGVEILDVFTRYKFRIAIGNNFKFKSVKKSIEVALNANVEPKVVRKNDRLKPEVKEQIDELIEHQLSNHPYWGIYILPNGEIDMISAVADSEKFINRTNLYKNVHEAVGGTLFLSDDGV